MYSSRQSNQFDRQNETFFYYSVPKLMNNFNTFKNYYKVVILTLFVALYLGLGAFDPALAKGKTTNMQHGKGEALRGLLESLQQQGVPVVVGKKQRVKAATTHRNRLKTIAKKMAGINHSMKPKQ
jgi:hypothetical protein